MLPRHVPLSLSGTKCCNLCWNKVGISASVNHLPWLWRPRVSGCLLRQSLVKLTKRQIGSQSHFQHSIRSTSASHLVTSGQEVDWWISAPRCHCLFSCSQRPLLQWDSPVSALGQLGSPLASLLPLQPPLLPPWSVLRLPGPGLYFSLPHFIPFNSQNSIFIL